MPRLMAACLALAAVPAVLAQPAKVEKLPPYDVNGLDTGSVWVPWLFVALFIGGSLAIAFKNPRRSHLD